jgi:hypothetical protein
VTVPAETELETTRDRPERKEVGRVSIVLPAYNEAGAIPIVVNDIRAHVPDAEIVVVDDASTDETAEIAREAGCTVVRHETNRGKGAGLRSGFRASHGEYVIFMDADATYPAAAVPEMVQLLSENDYVRADRAIDASNTPLINRIGNKVMERTLQTLHGLRPGDHLSGLYGFRREAFEALGTDAQGFDIEVEIGIKVKEQNMTSTSVPIDYLPRVGDKKLQPLQDGARILGRILRLVLIYRPLLLFGVPGAFLTIVSLVAAVLLASGPVQTGYLGLSIHTFIVAALGVLAGFQLLTFGIAGAAYRQSLGFSVSPHITRVTSPRARAVAATIGTLLAVGCGIWLLVTIVGWVLSGGPVFTATRALVSSATGAVFGLQLLSASLFVTLLAEKAR